MTQERRETLEEVFKWLRENLNGDGRESYADETDDKQAFLYYGDWDGWGESPKILTSNIIMR